MVKNREFDSHLEFMFALKYWGLTVGVLFVSLNNVSNKPDMCTIDVKVFPFRTYTFKCASCPKISRSHQPKCGVQCVYYLDFKKIKIKMNKVLCLLGNIYVSGNNLYLHNKQSMTDVRKE